MDIYYKQFDKYEEIELVYEFFKELLSEPYPYFTFASFQMLHSHHSLLAYKDGILIGAIIARVEADETMGKIGYIGMLGVKPENRRCGVGKELVNRTLASFLEREIYSVYLETEVDNIPSNELYRSLGFVKIGRLENYYLNLKDCFRLKKLLK
ncbi:N-alpha-acetyltransferase MAK3 [Astathelohania contejeani]|uniref:N-alpha-acetyltransferase MAK3 n=1 Tax=Astathelohania contejeani TaxID=164912 RepID=A0ABQ7HWX8_9MICR|nr:N-alpha-acetyltransferase MAK3 [Thelohania contejeani]